MVLVELTFVSETIQTTQQSDLSDKPIRKTCASVWNCIYAYASVLMEHLLDCTRL